MQKLIDTLTAAGREPVVLKGKVLVLPFGGRIIGLYPQEGRNVLWVNEQLNAEATAGAFLKDKGWINIGGERSWIAPEAETNVGDVDRFWDTYNVPKAMDPADFRVTNASEDSVTLETAMHLRFLRHECDVDLTVSRTVTVCGAPPVEIPPAVSFAGYTQDSILAAGGDLPEGVHPTIWNLIQVPGGGEIVIPVAEDARPRAFIATPVYTIAGGCIHCTVKTPESFKFSLRARDSRGFMAYLDTTRSPATLTACRFPVRDQEFYPEYPCEDAEDTGHMQQFYVDDGTFGGFGELEYQTPSLEPGRKDRVRDRGDVWSFAGPAPALNDILAALLKKCV